MIFIWKSDDQVIAIDRNDDGGSTFYEATVTPRGGFEIVDVYTLDAEQSLNSSAEQSLN